MPTTPTTLAPLPSATPRGDALRSAAARVGRSLLLPAAASALTVRYLVPSRMEGAAGGLLAAGVRFANEYPLLIGVALFVAFSETVRYWRSRATFAATPPLVAVRARDAAAGRRAAARFAVALVAVAAAALALRARVVETSQVVGPSMLPTLNPGDRLLVDRLAYRSGQLPRRADVVVFQAGAAGVPTGPGPRSLVKRVIGLPGDTVAFQGGNTLINGWPVPACDAGPYASVVGKLTVKGRVAVEFLEDRAYLTVRTPGEAPREPYTVQAGELYVMGDDRGMSSDSRIWNDRHGAGVPAGSVAGRVSRVLAGARRDGQLDFGQLLRPLGLAVRAPGVDLRYTEQRIAACLARRPAAATPPAPPAASLGSAQ